MPSHVRKLTIDAFQEAELNLGGARIAILGVAFKGNTADTRESPSFSVIGELRRTAPQLVVHDPLGQRGRQEAAGPQGRESQEPARRCQAMPRPWLVLTDHLEYRGLTGAGLEEAGSATSGW